MFNKRSKRGAKKRIKEKDVLNKYGVRSFINYLFDLNSNIVFNTLWVRFMTVLTVFFMVRLGGNGSREHANLTQDGTDIIGPLKYA